MSRKKNTNIRPSIQKLPPYVPGKTPAESGVIKLASNENPLGPSPKALAAIAQEQKKLNIYPEQYSLYLKEKLAEKLNLLQENIIIGNGSDEIMQFAAAAFLNAKEETIVAKGTFSTYEFVSRLFDASLVFVPLKAYNYDLAAMKAAVTLKTKLIFLSSPNSPTGKIITKKEMDAFLDGLAEDIIVIIDEAYGEFVESADYPDSLEYVKQNKNVLILRTFSKLYGLAGLRVGYGIAKPEIIKYLTMVKLPFNVSRLAQAGAVAALADTDFVRQSLANNIVGKTYLYRELDKLKLEYLKTEANFIFIKLKQPADEIFIKMMGMGVIIRPLASFGFPEAIRVTIGTPEQNEKFIEILKKALQ